MEPKLSTDERKMQEEMLRHEFSFDEKAWAYMEALLDQDKRKPIAGLPPKPIETMPGPGRNWGLAIVLLFSIGLGASSLLWWHFNPSAVEREFSATSAPSLKESSSSIPLTTSNNGDPAQVPQAQERASTTAGLRPTDQTTSLFRPRVKKRASFYAASSPDYNNPTTNFLQLSQHQEDIDEFNAIDPPSGIRQILDLSLLSIIPTPLFQPSNFILNLDSLIQPVKLVSSGSRRLEHGWVLGLNANTVDYNPLRLSVLPHLGYFRNYRFRPSLTLQTELILKYVSGYQLHAEFIDIVPGGSSHVVVNTNHILFLEVPLVLKHRYSPQQSWFLGIKPSGNVKIAPGDVGSYFNDGPNRHYTSQDGVRYFDLGLVIGWEWRYNKRLALDIRYNQGLLDLTFDQFYRDKSTLLNSDLQVSLRYILVK